MGMKRLKTSLQKGLSDIAAYILFYGVLYRTERNNY